MKTHQLLYQICNKAPPKARTYIISMWEPLPPDMEYWMPAQVQMVQGEMRCFNFLTSNICHTFLRDLQGY